MTDHLTPLWKLLAEGAEAKNIQEHGQAIASVLDTQIADLARQKRVLDEILGWKAPVQKAWQDLTKHQVVAGYSKPLCIVFALS